MTVRGAERAGLTAAVLLAAAAAQAAPPGRPREPVPFVATYTVAWHGINAGTSTLALTRTSPQRYLYTSTDTAWGIFRMVFPHPARQSSRLRVTAGEVEPLAFEASGIGNTVTARFDWKSGHVTGMAKGKPLDLKLEPGTQDPLSVQIAIMLKLRAGNAPNSFWMLNTDEVERFRYVRHEETTLDTPLGKLRTILYTSQAPGSDKTTWLWLAPALDYMPARAEQRVNGSTRISLAIRTFSRK